MRRFNICAPMDTIKLSCPCGQHIKVNRNAVGQEFRCPACDILLAVPDVPGGPETVEAYEAVTGVRLTKKKLKGAIIISVLMFIAGVVLGITGLGIHKIPVLISGSVVALFGFGWLLTVQFRIGRNHGKK